MKIQCDYCGNTYEDTQEKCPNCGAPNPSHQNTGKPKTIEELKSANILSSVKINTHGEQIINEINKG